MCVGGGVSMYVCVYIIYPFVHAYVCECDYVLFYRMR